MTFRLITVLYLFALLAASLAVFGAWGVLPAACVFAVWTIRNRSPNWWSLVRYSRVLVVLFVVGFLVLAMPDVRTPSLNNASSHRVKQLMLGIHNYESVNGHLPPAYVMDAQDRPLYSWRVAILPYLEEGEIYKQLHLDEPWDSSHNRPILDKFDATVFTSPRIRRGWDADGTTDYVAVVDSATVWPKDKTLTFAIVADGTSNTIALMEVGGLDIHWAEPRDVSLDEAIDLMTGQSSHTEEVVVEKYFGTDFYELRSRVVGFLDGHTEVLDPFKHREDALALLTTAGGEVIEFDYQVLAAPRSRRLKAIIHWNHIWGVAVWLALVLLPSVPAARQRIWPAIKESKTEE